MGLLLKKVLLVVNILLTTISYINCIVPKSCQLYTTQNLKLIKFYNEPIQEIELDANFNDENVDVCLSFYQDTYKHLNSVNLSLIRVNNESIRTSSVMFFEQWYESDLWNTKQTNQLCVNYKNSLKLDLTVQLQINVKNSGMNHLAVRDLVICHMQIIMGRMDPPLTPGPTSTTTTTTMDPTNSTITHSTGTWTVPNLPSTTTKDPLGSTTTNLETSTDSTASSAENTTSTEGVTATTDPIASWTVPKWPPRSHSITETTTLPETTESTTITDTTTITDDSTTYTDTTDPDENTTPVGTTTNTETVTTTTDSIASWTVPKWPPISYSITETTTVAETTESTTITDTTTITDDSTTYTDTTDPDENTTPVETTTNTETVTTTTDPIDSWTVPKWPPISYSITETTTVAETTESTTITDTTTITDDSTTYTDTTDPDENTTPVETTTNTEPVTTTTDPIAFWTVPKWPPISHSITETTTTAETTNADNTTTIEITGTSNVTTPTFTTTTTTKDPTASWTTLIWPSSTTTTKPPLTHVPTID